MCIYQASILERNEQVSRMRNIYHQASAVPVWVYDEEMPAQLHRLTLSSCVNMDTKTDNTITDNTIQFCCAQYWSRLWIIQEMLSARRLIVYCGSADCLWEEITENLSHIAASVHEIASPSLLSERRDASRPSLPNAPIWILKRSLEAKENLTLRQLLLRHGHSECEDKRDRVCGILGLASDCQNGEIPIDYAIPMNELFEKVLVFYSRILNPELLKRYEFHLRNVLL